MENFRLTNNGLNAYTPSGFLLIMRALRYLGIKALSIAVTIFIGVFITVMIANQPAKRGLLPGPPQSPFETSLDAQISLIVNSSVDISSLATIPLDANGSPDQEQINKLIKQQRDSLREKLHNESGLNLPYLPRYLLWTKKALTFDWGQLGNRSGSGFTAFTTPTKGSASDLLKMYLPNTLLLMGTAYLLVFLIGMPLSLYLARNYGKPMDRLFAFLSPISSVPSWVIGILLLGLFAYQLHWLPFSGMYDTRSPRNLAESLSIVPKHMILPVAAITLSLLFQVVYAWRTFFIIYSEEDYVELARAKGLSPRVLMRQYILKPALPYIITSFATTLISFWQLTMALEAVFQWPGIGWLYIRQALPNFWGESMEPGELIIAVGIVVIFAYLLGTVVFVLDLVYVIIDPRIRLVPASDNQKQISRRIKSKGGSWITRIQAWFEERSRRNREQIQRLETRRSSRSGMLVNFKVSLSESFERCRLFMRELRRYPSAMFGLAVIIILFAGSIYAVTSLPYDQYGRDYDRKLLTGHSYIPRIASPIWTNIFNHPLRLSTIIMDQNDAGVSKSTNTLDNGWVEKTFTFTFDYPYKEMPSEMFLYFDPIYTEKLPFATLEWEYPDGRTLELKRTIANQSSNYDFGLGISTNQLLKQYPEWRNWFVSTGQYPTPAFELLFAEPGSSLPVPQHGTYHLIVHGLLFEPGSDLHLQLVLLGKVYGLAGTDYNRRDLIIPLFWGMPFALLIGLMGSMITTLVAMLLPAIGVWYGGWIDNLIQRFTEINMVLPGLTIAVLANVLFNINIWIILGIVIVINAFGSPIKTLRSALLQAVQAPYIETARSYGASDFRIITRYLIPRILPVLIPQLVAQVPSFIFWEATLGFFNIKSPYPSWGRIIYDGLAHGSLYGSIFWVLEPIFLLLLTSLAFAMLGFALERILNPRILDNELSAE